MWNNLKPKKVHNFLHKMNWWQDLRTTKVTKFREKQCKNIFVVHLIESLLKVREKYKMKTGCVLQLPVNFTGWCLCPWSEQRKKPRNQNGKRDWENSKKWNLTKKKNENIRNWEIEIEIERERENVFIYIHWRRQERERVGDGCVWVSTCSEARVRKSGLHVSSYFAVVWLVVVIN